MIFVSKEHYFNNGWDCRKCDKMTEHLKKGSGKDAKLIATLQDKLESLIAQQEIAQQEKLSAKK